MDWKKWKSLKENNIVKEKVQLDGDFSFEEIISRLDSLRDSTFIFFDTETTGFKPEFEQITQVAGIAIEYKDGKAVEKENINLYSILNPSIEKRLEKDMEEGSEYREWLDRQRENIEKIEKNNNLSPVQKEARIQLAKDPKYVLRLTGYVKQKGYVFDDPTDLGDFLASPDLDMEEVKEYMQDFSFGDDEQQFSLHGTATDADGTEEQVLNKFYSFVVDHDNPILVAHNSNFDMDMVNGRNSLYNIPSLKEGSNVKDVLDTLDVATSYKNALNFLLKKYKKELEEINKIRSSFSLKEEYRSPFSGLPTHDIEEPKDPSVDVSKLSPAIMDKINSLPEEQREVELRYIALETLVKSVSNTLGTMNSANKRFSRRLGDLATNMKVSPEGWHDALADVRMLMSVYNNMYETIKMAMNYEKQGTDSILSLKESFSLLSEMEPYQRMVTQKHPAAKKRLIGHGKNKDKSSPYKFKLSFKRGKSAPPIG